MSYIAVGLGTCDLNVIIEMTKKMFRSQYDLYQLSDLWYLRAALNVETVDCHRNSVVSLFHQVSETATCPLLGLNPERPRACKTLNPEEPLKRSCRKSIISPEWSFLTKWHLGWHCFLIKWNSHFSKFVMQMKKMITLFYLLWKLIGFYS